MLDRQDYCCCCQSWGLWGPEWVGIYGRVLVCGKFILFKLGLEWEKEGDRDED
jgi:hypothetical protein